MNKKISLLVIIAAIMSLSSCILLWDSDEGSLSVKNYSSYSRINRILIGDDAPENYDSKGNYDFEHNMRTFWRGGSIDFYEHKTFDLDAGTYVVSVETPHESEGYYCYNVVIESGHTTRLAFDGNKLYEY